MPSFFRDHLISFSQLGEELLSNEKMQVDLEKACALVREVFKSGKKAITCGNGGSMCDAIHFAEELSGRYRDDRQALPAIAISDPGHLTCVLNDYGSEFIFSRQVEALGLPGDLLLCFSTSGNSPNIIKALEAAKRKKMHSLALLGKGGGLAKDYAEHSVIIPSAKTERIQEAHTLLLHILIESIERELFPQLYS